MRNFIAGLGWIAFTCFAAHAQPAFEVASVKASKPPDGTPRGIGCRGGPGTSDPGLITCENMSPSLLVTMWYDIMRFQLSGPDWMDGTRFDVTAKVPPGTTKEQVRLMEQNLLAERFKLSLHHEKKEMQIYELTVAKNGPKLKEAAPPPTKPDVPASGPPPKRPSVTLGSDGFPEILPNVSGMWMLNGHARRQQLGETMDQFAQFLTGQLGLPVNNSTGLPGKYDIVLSWAPDWARQPPAEGGASSAAADASDPPPTLVQAVQKLGLKLESKKGPVDILVIDHMEKTPVEN